MKKLYRSYKLPKIEFIKCQLDQIINFEQTILNQTEITVLAYVYCFGIDAKDKLFQDRILTNAGSVPNYISRLTRLGYLVKEENSEATHRGKKGYSDIYINPDFKILDENFIQVSVIEIDPDSDMVYHPNFRR